MLLISIGSFLSFMYLPKAKISTGIPTIEFTLFFIIRSVVFSNESKVPFKTGVTSIFIKAFFIKSPTLFSLSQGIIIIIVSFFSTKKLRPWIKKSTVRFWSSFVKKILLYCPMVPDVFKVTILLISLWDTQIILFPFSIISLSLIIGILYNSSKEFILSKFLYNSL